MKHKRGVSMGIMPNTVQDSVNLFNTSALLSKLELVPYRWNHSLFGPDTTFWGTG
jgi:hypothetical protein